MKFNQDNFDSESISNGSILDLMAVAKGWDDESLYQAFESDWNVLGSFGFIYSFRKIGKDPPKGVEFIIG